MSLGCSTARTGVTFYEVVKNATNKLTEQMADCLRPHGFACVAVSPGWMRLERMDLTPEDAARAESPEFPGRAIAALAADPNVLAKSGRVYTTPALAREYGFRSEERRVGKECRSR